MVLVLLVVATGCVRSSADPGPSGLFDVGGGRKLFLECQGAGSPTVFIIPGKGSYAEAWNYVVPPDDPIRSSPYDIITQAELEPSPDAVQPTVAKTTQVAPTTDPTPGPTAMTCPRRCRNRTASSRTSTTPSR